MSGWLTLVALLLFVFAVGDALRARMITLFNTAIAAAAVIVVLADFPVVVELLLLAAVFAIPGVPAALIRRAVYDAAERDDLTSVKRWSTWAMRIVGDRGWLDFSDITAWRVKAETDRFSARAHLERVVDRGTTYQLYADLLLVAVYGDVDIGAAVQERIAYAPKRAQPLMLDLGISWLVNHGRTSDALAMLATASAENLTMPSQWRLLADIAAAVGDRATVERLLQEGAPAPSHPAAEKCRAIAERAHGDAEAGDARLRALDLPPEGVPALIIATVLAHPTPVFDERALDGDAARGLERYRELVGSREE